MNRIILLLIFCDSFFAKKEDIFSQFTHQHHWMSQFSLWEELNKDPTLVDSSLVLNSFKNLGANSRYGYLTQIDQTIAGGDLATAQNLLSNYSLDSMKNSSIDSTTSVQMADDSTGDTLVSSYKEYLQYYLNFQNGNLTCTDSSGIEMLASKCPFKHGSVVYNARALYNALNQTQRIFSYNCDDYVFDSSSDRKGRIVNDNSGNNGDQTYLLIPNPNNGSFTLQQTVSDDKAVSIEVYDIIGQRIFSATATFLNQLFNVNLVHVNSGVYLLKLVDATGKKFNFKFLVK